MGWGDESDSDDKVVWLDYHNAEIRKLQDRLNKTEAELEMACDDHARTVDLLAGAEAELATATVLLRVLRDFCVSRGLTTSATDAFLDRFESNT